MTKGGEKEIVSACGNARVITPRSRAALTMRAAIFSVGSNRVAGCLAGDELHRADQAGAADLADQRMIGERRLQPLDA